MNTLLVSVVVLVWFYLGYRYYGGYIEKWIVKPDDSQPTPAHQLNDGVDYVPSKKRLLWGNHFASIAGAGPIIGPILAVSIFGWGYTLLWVALGAVFLGAVHDYLALMFSARNGGRGLAELAESVLGNTTRYVAAILIYLMLLLLVTAFMVSVAQSLISVPALVIPTFGLVGAAVLMGLAVYRFGVNDLLAIVIGVVLAYVLIYVGYRYPVSLPAAWGEGTIMAVWLLILSLYCLLASVAPIWILLQPRDVLSSVKLVVGMILGFLAIIIIHPQINAPFSTGGFISQGKPIWPILFITVACGAISGFHSLVSAGTTSRQLAKESDGKPIAFGGMIMEGAVALLVIMIVSGGLKWGLAPKGASIDVARLYFGDALAKSWIIAFGNGFGHLVGSIGIPYLTMPLAALLGAVMVKSFILTTLDTGTRLARFLVTDTLASRAPVFKNRVLSSLVILVPAYILAVTNSYKEIWKMFGTANQLIAGIALITATVLLARAKKPRLVALIPAILMLITTMAALAWEMFSPTTGYFTSAKPNPSLGVISVVLVILSLAVVIQGVRSLARSRLKTSP